MEGRVFGKERKGFSPRSFEDHGNGNAFCLCFTFDHEGSISKVMALEALLSYLTAGIFGGVTFFLAFRLYLTHRSRIVLSFLYFSTAYMTLGFLNLIGRHQAILLLRSQGDEMVMTVNYLFAFITFPIVPFSVYLFIRLMTNISGRPMTKTFRIIYLSIWSLCFLAVVFGVKQAFDGQNDSVIRALLPSLNILAICFYLGANLYLLLTVKSISPKRKRKSAFHIGMIFLSLQILVYAITSGPAAPLLGQWRPHITIMLYFFFNLPPLLYLRSRLTDFTPTEIPALVDDRILLTFFEQHSISRREGEIIRLILAGRSNSDIERELFISISTVKNHIYNIFQKLKVKNRIQLSMMIQNFARRKRQ